MEADGACDTQAMHSRPYFKQMIPLTALSYPQIKGLADSCVTALNTDDFPISHF